jgi:hypothetical protein
MKTAEEYQKQIKVIAEAIGYIERSLLKAEMSDKPDRSLIKIHREGIKSLEEKIKYLSSQRRKAERVEARLDAYAKSLKS